MLHAIGLPELVTYTLEEYEALALNLANNPDRLSELRTKLVRNRDTTALFDSERSCRHMESAYETMFETWRAGDPPAPFAVQPIATG